MAYGEGTALGKRKAKRHGREGWESILRLSAGVCGEEGVLGERRATVLLTARMDCWMYMSVRIGWSILVDDVDRSGIRYIR